MQQPNSSNRDRPPEMKPSGNAMPSANGLPVFRRPLAHSQKRRRFTRIAITAMCAAGLAAFLARGMLLPTRASEPRETRSEPGLTYTNARVPSEPWSIHVLKIDRSRKDLTFFSAHARDK